MARFRLGVLLVRWNQTAPAVHQPVWYEHFFCRTDRPGVARYWWWQSGGQLEIGGRVFGWFDLRASQQDLRVVEPGATILGREPLARFALKEAIERGFPPSGYDALVVVPDAVPPTGWGVGGGAVPSVTATATLPGGVSVTVTGPASVLPVRVSTFDFIAHELGHNLGLDHSFGPSTWKLPNAQPGEYGHHYCVMSAQSYGGSDSQLDPNAGEVEQRLKPPGLNGATRVARGWTRPVDLPLEPGLNTVQTLTSLGAPPDNPAPRAIHIRRSAQETYTVEFRTPADAYDGTVLCPMVVVHQLRGSTADLAHPGTSSATYLGEIHGLAPGAFDGPGFRVELLSIVDGRVAVVRVIDRTGLPTPARPTVLTPLYVRRADGVLLWYRHDGRENATGMWSGGHPVDSGWQDQRIVPGGGGVLYSIDAAGDLWWKRHEGRAAGRPVWSERRRVGDGWTVFARTFSNGSGRVYGIEPDGDVWWYHHTGYATGAYTWRPRRQVHRGWHQFTAVFGGGDGVIYCVRPDGTLLWYRHLGWADGSDSWQGPREVDRSWGTYRHVFATGTGQVYAVASNGDLIWRRHDGRADGSRRWTGPKRVGTGWNSFDFVASS